VKQVDIYSLGCSKNLVDAEKLMKQIDAMGYRCRFEPKRSSAPIVIINTCGFIADAKEESLQTILHFAKKKKAGKLEKLFVMGCLSQRYMNDLPGLIPEVDAFYGKFDSSDLLKVLGSAEATYSCQRVITTPSHYAYLKVSEGCNRNCSYCAIPIITGNHKSRPIEEIVSEAQWLVSQGVVELQVIAQDLSYYGIDLYHESRLAQLLEVLSAIEGLKWIRLHYAYPTQFPYDILPIMREKPNICKYLDIALQHASDNMLSHMHRHITKQEQTDLIQRIRQEVPGIHIRTTMLLGHPGETEGDVDELISWIKQMRFERLGAFAYSEEEGTFAARHYNDNIPQDIKQARVDRLMKVQEQISLDINQQKVGQTLPVIIDREDAEYYIGRTEFDSPEVDNEVLIRKGDAPTPKKGNIYSVKIIGCEEFDLFGQIIND